MATRITNRVSGQILIKDERAQFNGDELLYISVRDSLRHDAPCIELGSKTITLRRGQLFPIDYQFYFDPNQAHMDFKQLKSIPGGVTVSASIERNDQLLYINNTDIPLADNIDIQLVKVE